MDSSTSKRLEEARKQAEIRKQIALLQSQLKDVPGDSVEPAQPPTTPKKRKQEQETLLASATPSPKKRKQDENEHALKGKVRVSSHSSSSTSKPRPSHPSLLQKPSANRDNIHTGSTSKPATSSVLSKLATFASTSTAEVSTNIIARSSGFEERPPAKPVEDTANEERNNRDENLAIIEELEIGPYDHKAPFDDPHFKKLEPNSGIRLLSRELPNDEFQDYLRGRYYLSPSKLYSVIRLLPNKQGYDVPVEGDWVTIAVVAERGPLRHSKAPVGIGKDDLAELPENETEIKSLSLDAPPNPAKPGFQRWKGKAKEEIPKSSGKKYINLKLVDFGCRVKSSATAGRSVIRGDAFLSLLLFESDRVEEVVREDGKKEKIYRGGSRGAFERMSKLKEGAVVALLNPKILKPFQRSGDTPHPTDNILAITPESLQSVVVIGHSLDLGMCHVEKRDGKVCGGWCDKRVSDICDYHVQHAVQRKRAGRAEFSMGTSGMTSGSRKKLAYDPSRQWGLKPSTDGPSGSGATYVVSGHIVSDRRDSNGLFVNETVGRDAQAKTARQISAKDADRALQQLLKRDKGGSKAVKAARDFGKKMVKERAREKEDIGGKKGKTGDGRKGGKQKKKRDETESEGSEDEGDEKKLTKNAFSASLVKNLGFDPTAKDGRKVRDAEVQRKLDTLATLQASRKDIALGPRPGKLKSNVWAPDNTNASRQQPDMDDGLRSPTPSDDELIIEPPVPRGSSVPQSDDELLDEPQIPHSPSPPHMVSLDSSDTEL